MNFGDLAPYLTYTEVKVMLPYKGGRHGWGEGAGWLSHSADSVTIQSIDFKNVMAG